VVGYDMLDHHLSKSCEAKLQLCPNRCSRTKKFTLAQLQKHIDEECPKECVPCPECKQIKYRNEIPEHLEGACDKVAVKCPHCGQQDLRIAFRTGKHECLQNREEAFYEGNNRDRGLRNFEEIASRQGKEEDEYQHRLAE